MQDQGLFKTGLKEQGNITTPESIQKGEEKDQNAVLISLAVILILILLGLVGYISYDFGRSTGRREKPKTTIPTEATTDTTTSTANPETTTTTTVATIDPYEGWETYTNKELGFTFKYLSDWIFKDTEGSPYDWRTDTGDPLGFRVNLTKDNWVHSVIYKSYWDDVAGKKMAYAKEIIIGEKLRVRVGYMNWDNPTEIEYF